MIIRKVAVLSFIVFVTLIGSTTAPRLAAQVTSTLLINVDVDSTLMVDGEAIGKLDAQGSRKITVIPGDHLVEVIAAADPTVRVKKVVTLEAGRQSFVMLKLEGILSERQKIKKLRDRLLSYLGAWSTDVINQFPGASELHYKVQRFITLESNPNDGDRVLGIYRWEAWPAEHDQRTDSDRPKCIKTHLVRLDVEDEKQIRIKAVAGKWERKDNDARCFFFDTQDYLGDFEYLLTDWPNGFRLGENQSHIYHR